jgi:hypothetical protein
MKIFNSCEVIYKLFAKVCNCLQNQRLHQQAGSGTRNRLCDLKQQLRNSDHSAPTLRYCYQKREQPE